MLDDFDRALVHALELDGRVPFARVAGVLGVSTQTVTRRYHRLRTEAGLRVVGLTDPDRAGGSRWLVRLTAAPTTAVDVAQGLARRPDTSWVRLTSGGTEIVAVVTVPAGTAGPSLLLHDVPRTASVTAVAAFCLLHLYRGGPRSWSGRSRGLTPHQVRLLAPDLGGRAATVGTSDPERRLLDVLARDGRAGYAALAAVVGWSATTVARRLEAWRCSGSVFFDVDVDDAQLGVGTRALLWLGVAPPDLDRVGTALATHPELAFVAATTGPTTLVAQVLCTDPADLHRYLTGPLARLDGVRTVETTPVLRTVKSNGPLRP